MESGNRLIKSLIKKKKEMLLLLFLIIGILNANSFTVNAMNSHKLIYFDAKGAAEMIRILLKVGNIAFEDYRFLIKIKEGGGFETPEFDIAKSNGLLVSNMNRAPVLQLPNGRIVGQSKAIERYICKLCNFLGENDEESFYIDCCSENIRDIKDKWGKIRMTGGIGSNKEKEEAIKKFYESELKEWLEKLEKSLPENQNINYAIGSRISYADIQIWYLMTQVFEVAEIEKSSENCPKLKLITNIVSKNENLQKWLSERPQTMF